MAVEFTAQFSVVDPRMDIAYPSFLEGMVYLVVLGSNRGMDIADRDIYIIYQLVKQMQ